MTTARGEGADGDGPRSAGPDRPPAARPGAGPRRRPRLALRLAALAIALAAALLAGEGLMRLFVGPPRPVGRLYFRDAAGEVVGEPGREDLVAREAMRRGLVEALPQDQTPRFRTRFAPGARFFTCYEDQDRLRCDWLDERGCVEVRINRFGLREREEVAPDNKRPGERRIVCIGDSFTFGWGIPVEQNWVRRLESCLESDGSDYTTVNCGASGAICVDEYEWGLRTRFGAFQPDLVLVTLCLNDLLPSSGLFVQGRAQPQPTGSVLLDHLRRALQPGPLDLDPARDWVGELLALPEAEGTAGNLYGHDRPFAAMWSQGVPQRSLVAMRDWCAQRNVAFGVILWPFLQGLDAPTGYPFRGMHERVAAHCASEGIAFLDVHPSLAGRAPATLWVTPSDMHANPRAQELALPAITAFARELLPAR